jgi:hypothetical protein
MELSGWWKTTTRQLPIETDRNGVNRSADALNTRTSSLKRVPYQLDAPSLELCDALADCVRRGVVLGSAGRHVRRPVAPADRRSKLRGPDACVMPMYCS